MYRTLCSPQWAIITGQLFGVHSRCQASAWPSPIPQCCGGPHRYRSASAWPSPIPQCCGGPWAADCSAPLSPSGIACLLWVLMSTSVWPTKWTKCVGVTTSSISLSFSPQIGSMCMNRTHSWRGSCISSKANTPPYWLSSHLSRPTMPTWAAPMKCHRLAMKTQALQTSICFQQWLDCSRWRRHWWWNETISTRHLKWFSSSVILQLAISVQSQHKVYRN